MELVIRTAHGGADVDVSSYDDDTTLREVLEIVTGLSAPNVVTVDGRPCRTDETLAEAIASFGLRIGSTIDVSNERVDEQPDPSGGTAIPLVRLRQLTGRGAGQVVDLPAGRYRFGAGRRLVERELGPAVVEEEAFVVTVAARPALERASHPSALARGAPDDLEVLVRPGANVAGELGPYTPMLGSQLFDRELPWSGERLSVGGRVFDLLELDDPSSAEGTPIGAARIGRPDRNGVRSFDAAGTIAVLADDDRAAAAPIHGALARADDPTRTLWRRRPDTSMLRAPIGLTADHRSSITLDLERHRGAAVAGGGDFTAGMLRTILLELTTALGPADLDVVVVASAGRLGRWDWAKWLPHVRGGDPTETPRFLTTDDEVEAWIATQSFVDGTDDERATPDLVDVGGSGASLPPPPAERSDDSGTVLPPPAGRPYARPTTERLEPRTLLLIDDAAQWIDRESSLRRLCLDPPRGLHLVVAVDRAADAPAACTTVIEETRPDAIVGASADDADTVAATRLFGPLCRVVERVGTDPVVTTDVRPALVEAHVATALARSLSSYDDLRLRRANAEPPRHAQVQRPTLGEVLAVVDTPSALPAPPSSTVPIGRRADASGQALGDQPMTWLEAATVDLAAAGITGVAADRPDDTQLLAAIALGAAARHRPRDFAILLVSASDARWLRPLPHLLGTVDGDDTEQVGRVIRRLADALTREARLEVLVLIDGAVAADAGPRRLTDATVAFAELASALDRVHLVATAAREHTDMLRRHLGTRCGAFIEARRDGSAILAHRSNSLDVGTAVVMTSTDLLLPTVHAAPPPVPEPGLQVAPFVHGRPLTPIERRLRRRNDPLRDAARRSTRTGQTSGPTTASAEAAATRRSLLPPPFPERVAQESLRSTVDGPVDGVAAIGIVDRTDGDGFDVYRWAPGSGSLLAVGNRRSGTGILTDLMAAALVDADVDVWALDPLPQRRRAIRRLPRCRLTADPESSAAVLRFVDRLEEQVEARRRGDDAAASTSDQLAAAVRGGPRPMVVFLADLRRTLAHFDDDEARAVMERLAAIVTPTDPTVPVAIRPAPIAIVAAASRRSEIEPLLESSVDVLVGTVDDAERRGFGVPERTLVVDADGDGIAGRCWSTTRQRLVQLATPPDSIERFIKGRAADPTGVVALPPPAPDAVASSEPIGSVT